MSRNTKIALAVVGGLVAVCCIGAVLIFTVAPAVLGRVATNVFDQAVADSPEAAAEVGREMADYQLPAGYQEEMGMDIIGTRMVVITAQDNRDMSIMLMQFPGGNLSAEEMRRQMEQVYGQQFDGTRGFNMEVEEQRDVTIGDQTSTLTILQGEDSTGTPVRQAFTTFPGKTGTVMLMAFGQGNDWDEDAVEEFLNSIE